MVNGGNMNITYIHDVDYHNWVLGPTHPTQGRRYTNALALTQAYADQFGLHLDVVGGRTATDAELLKVHTPEYIAHVADGFGPGVWTDQNHELAQLARKLFGGTLAGVERIIAGDTMVVHLPGAKHHAQADTGSGFCVFADFAAAALELVHQYGLRVAVLDVDVHHGDGTENLTRAEPNVLTFSIHQGALFPWSATEREDNHELRVYNRPLVAGDGDTELVVAVQEFVDICQEFKPDVILVAAGGDGHREDPLASIEYSVPGYGLALSQIRAAYPTMPILLGGAGGYCPDTYTPMMWFGALCGLAGADVTQLDEASLLRTLAEVGAK